MKLTTLPQRARKTRQRGVAAVELAALLIVLVLLLFTPCMIALSLFQSTVAQRAVHNAAHMVAMYPPFQRVAPGSNPTGEAATMVADALIAAGVVAPDSGIADQVEATCPTPYSPKCRSTAMAPEQIRVGMLVDVFDLHSTFLSDHPIQVIVFSTDRYAR